MEAPEKIYLIRNFPRTTSLNTTNDYHGKYLHEWYKSREKEADVEYTRTDAFIDKVVEWLYQRHAVDLDVANIEKFIEDFKKDMEG